MLIFHKVLVFFIILSAFFVVCFQNPLYSVFFLILTFFNTSLLLIFLELEFLGLLYIMVYVGAILVLVLFIILSFNLKSLYLQKEIFKLTVFYQLTFLLLIIFWQIKTFYFFLEKLNALNFMYFKNYFYFLQFEYQSIQIFGLFLYNQLFPFLILVGLILLIAMLGSIILTIENTSYKSQNDYKDRDYKAILFYKN